MGHVHACVLLIVVVVPFAVHAEEPTRPVPVDQKCSIPADERWTPQEKFVWDRVCIGATADFNAGSEYGGKLDPKKTSLPDGRILSSEFLRTIVLGDKYRRELTGNVIHIVGARFVDQVILTNAEIGVGISLDKSLLEGGADFRGLRSKHPITINGSKVTKLLNMDRLNIVDQSLSMDGSEFDEVSLTYAHIGGQLFLNGSKVARGLDATQLRVNQSLSMEQTVFGEGIFYGALIGGEFYLTKSKVANLGMGSLQVGHSLIMDDIEIGYGGLVLRGARIGGEFHLRKVTVRGDLTMEGIRVNQPLYVDDSDLEALRLSNAHIGALVLHRSNVAQELDFSGLQIDRHLVIGPDTKIRGPVDLSFARIGSSLILEDTVFHKDVDLTGAQITGEFRLGARSGKLQWLDNSTLVLRNAQVDAVRDDPDSWPSQIEITGFTYRGLGSLADRSLDWFRAWLGKQEKYTAAPYEHLATILRSYGRARDADEILYASKQRDHEQAPFPRSLWLTAINWLIGYGHHIERALFWVAGFVIAGVAVLRLSGQGPKNGMPYGITYSFDMLLPIIQLRRKHYEIDLEGWPRYYFYVHKMMGWVLAAFLGAGLTGLTK